MSRAMINIQSCDHAGVCQHPTRACPTHTVCTHKIYGIPGLAIDLQPAPAPAAFAWQSPKPIYLSQSLRPLPEPDYLLDTTWKDWVGGVLVLMAVGFIYEVSR